MANKKLKDYLLARVKKTNDCWLWTLCNFGITRIGKANYNKESYPAHELSYVAFVGKIPKNNYIKHTCKNKNCINPKHLYSSSSISGNNPKKFLIDRCKKKKNGCWVWALSKIKSGYGQTTFNGKTYLSHRLSFEVFKNKTPKNKYVLHKCDNPPCCNPDHLFLGNHKDNMLDMTNKQRQAKGNKHGLSKLTRKNVIRLRSLKKSYSLRVLAERFGVSKAAIQKALTKKSWRHVK